MRGVPWRRPEEPVLVVPRHGGRGRAGRKSRGREELPRGPGAHPLEVLRQELGEAAALRGLEEVAELAELEAVRVRKGLLRDRGELRARPFERHPRAVGLDQHDARVRVDDRGPAQVLVGRLAAAHVARLDDELDLGAVRRVPERDVLGDHPRLVLLGVDDELQDVRGLLLLHLRGDPRRAGRREVGVEDGGGDPDPLLAAGLPVRMKARAVEEPGEDVRDLATEDPGPRVGHRDPKALVGLL